jgi:hypothetical protein
MAAAAVPLYISPPTRRTLFHSQLLCALLLTSFLFSVFCFLFFSRYCRISMRICEPVYQSAASLMCLSLSPPVSVYEERCVRSCFQLYIYAITLSRRVVVESIVGFTSMHKPNLFATSEERFEVRIRRRQLRAVNVQLVCDVYPLCVDVRWCVCSCTVHEIQFTSGPGRLETTTICTAPAAAKLYPGPECTK